MISKGVKGSSVPKTRSVEDFGVRVLGVSVGVLVEVVFKEGVYELVLKERVVR